MAPPASASEFYAQPAIQRKLQVLYKDSDAALKMARTFLSSSTAKYCSGSTLSAYKGDVARLEKCAAGFNRASFRLSFGKTDNLAEIAAAYAKFVLAMETLEQANAKHIALMSAGFAGAVALLLKMVMGWEKEVQKRTRQLEKEIGALWKSLGKVKWQVLEAKVQTSLHLIVNGLLFSLGPLSLAAKAAATVGGIGTNYVITAALGPSAKSVFSLMDKNSDQPALVVGRLTDGAAKMASIASAALMLKVDLNEINEAELNLKLLQKRLKAASDEYQDLLGVAKVWEGKIGKQKKLYDTALKGFHASARKFSSSKSKREQLLKEFKKWR